MNISKWILAAVLAAAPLASNATTYAVWPAAGEGEVQIPYNFYDWHNINLEEVSVENVTAMKVSMANLELRDASCGWHTPAGWFNLQNLVGKVLEFDAMVTGEGSWNVRLTGQIGDNNKEQDATIVVPADGAFHHVVLNVAELFPLVNENWAAEGAGGYTFALVGSGLNAESAVYFTNCKYVESVIVADVTDITMNSANINYTVNLPAGASNASITIDGNAVNELTGVYSMTNLEQNREYTCLIVAKCTVNGVEQTYERNVRFTTLRDTSVTPVWYGITDITGFSAEYSIAYNADGTLTVEAVIETEKETPEGDRNFHIYVGGDEWLKLHDNGAGVLAGTTNSTFEEGSTITWEWYLPYAGGVYQQANQYVVGSANDKPASLRISAEAVNVTTNSAEIQYTVTGATTYEVYYKVGDGQFALATANPIVLSGLTDYTEYHVEIYAKAGEMESSHKTVTFKTLNANARDYVYADVFETTFRSAWRAGGDPNNRQDIPAALPWSVTYRADETAVYRIDFTGYEDIVGLVPQIWNGAGIERLVKNAETGIYEYEFGHREFGAEAAMSHYIAYDGPGAIDVRTPYTKWGMEQAAPSALRITANAANITYNSAEIAYSVTGGDVYDVYYKLGEGDFIKAEANPIVLTGLAEATSYTVELFAADEAGESQHVSVNFRTARENAVDLVYSDLFNAEFKNAFLAGETEAMRRTIYVTLPWSVLYRADGSAVYSVNLSAVEKVVGLVPQIYWNGHKNLTKNAETGFYEYEFGAQEMDGGTAISHYFAYSGGVVDSRTPYTNWGMEKTAPVIGEAANLRFNVSKTNVQLNEDILLTAVLTDAEGHYLPANDVEYSANSSYVVIEGNIARITEIKGTYTITAKAAGFEASANVTAFATESSSDLIAGVQGVVNPEYIQAGEVGHVTDGNLGTQLEWACGTTHEHYIIFDLTGGDAAHEGYYIEAVNVIFEGAYAKRFTVELSNEAPAELGGASAGAPRRAAAAATTFANETEGTEHVFTQNPEGQHRYVALRTQEAVNAGWGIKLKELQVYGSTEKPGGTSTILNSISVDNDEDAPVEYYNLNGVRVENPAAGIYIRRQGTTVSKVIVK